MFNRQNFINLRLIKCSVIMMAILAFIVGCNEDDPSDGQLSLIVKTLKSHEWAMFDDTSDTSTCYTIFNFFNDYQCNKVWVDSDGNEYKTRQVEYMIDGEILNIDGYTYSIIAVSEYKITLEKLYGIDRGETAVLWDCSDDFMQTFLIGEWEYMIGPEGYHVHTFKEDGTYEFKSNYKNFATMSVTEFGSYKIDKMRVVCTGEEAGIPVQYSFQPVLLDDNKIRRFGSVVLTRITDGVGNHPANNTLQSPYLNDITTGLWIEFKKSDFLSDDPKIYQFDANTLKCTTTFYSDYKDEWTSYSKIFKIFENKLYPDMESDVTTFLIEEDSDGISLHRRYDSNEEYTQFYRYYDAQQFYKDHIVGMWEKVSNNKCEFLMFNEDMTYEYQRRTSNGEFDFDIKGKATLDRIFLTVTHDSYTGQEGAVNEGYIWQPEVCEISVCEIDNLKYLSIRNHNSLGGTYSKIRD